MNHDLNAEPAARLAGASDKAVNAQDHALPMFEAAASRRHSRIEISQLKRQVKFGSLKTPFALKNSTSFVQFAGFPRSGHSLIGALLDAHPDAVIAHELDAMGLLHKGFSINEIMRLCIANSEGFAQDGRWWNGFCYEVPDAPKLTSRPKAIGDKKGDWAIRWCAHDPSLLNTLTKSSNVPCKWILVTRHPFDNVATMSIRLGRIYDKVRIENNGDPVATKSAIAEAQERGEIAQHVSDKMVQDYRALATGVADVKARIDHSHWHEINYENFVADSATHLKNLALFLDLDPRPDWIEAASAIVAPRASKSRNRLQWKDGQREALLSTIDARDFLQSYRDDR